jgi:hypothetical protein
VPQLNEQQGELVLEPSESPRSVRSAIRLKIGSNGQIWTEEFLSEPWSGWVVASRVVADERGLPVLGEVRIFPAEPTHHSEPGEWSGSAVPRAGLPWTLPRRGVALSEHARFASNMISGALWTRGKRTDRISLYLVGALTAAGFNVGAVKAPAALRDAPSSNRGRPKVWSDADCARVALIYDAAIEANRSPQRDVAAAVGKPITVARNLIARARRLGKIPKAAKQGRRAIERLSAAQRDALRREAKHSRIKARRA